MTANPMLERLVRPELRALRAYHVADARGLIKLDAMENPYAWPPELVEDWLRRLREVEVNRYPDPAAAGLKARLRERMAIPSSAELVLGNGSDELIQLVMMAVAAPGRVVMAPEPGFVMYRMIAQFLGMEYVGVPLRAADFALDGDAMLAALRRHRPAVLFLAYPNNPTGNLFDPQLMRTLIDAAPGLVVVDEAYFSFASHSFISELGTRPNLLVMRTVSKMGLAGLRLGLLAGPADWLGEIEKLRLPYNINVLTQVSAELALDAHAVLDAQVAAIIAERTALSAALAARPGLQVYPSEANFVLVRTRPGRAAVIFESLRASGVLIKNLSPAGGLLADCLRITVGSPAENAALLEALDRVPG